MTKEQAERKLKALKALAERGVGGEKETACQFLKTAITDFILK